MILKALAKIRGIAINMLATTALSVLIMCTVGLLQGFELWGVTIPFEMLLVNFLMHMGFFALEKIDFQYSVIKYSIMIVYVLGLIIGFGFLFHWFEVLAVWVFCIVGIAVFVLAIVFDAFKLKRDAEEINSRLNKIKQRSDIE